MTGNGDRSEAMFDRVKEYIAQKGHVDRVSIAQGLKVSIGDVAAIVERLGRQGLISFEAVGPRGPRYHWMPGVTPGPSSPAPPVTPPKKRVTGSGRSGRRAVTPKKRAAVIRKGRASPIAPAIVPMGEGAEFNKKISMLAFGVGQVVGGLGASAPMARLSHAEALVQLATTALQIRAEILSGGSL